MKISVIVLSIFVLLIPIFLEAQPPTYDGNVDLNISNPRIEGNFFKFELQIKRTDDWGGFGEIGGVGNCDFYFDYNAAGFTGNPALSNINSNITNNPDDYEILTQINGGQLEVKITYLKVSAIWNLTVDLYTDVCTVEWQIGNPSENSGVKWDETNTGFTDGDGDAILPHYFGTADIALPVVMSSFSAAYKDGGVNVEWETESEINNQGFEVLRSVEEDSGYNILSSYQYNPSLEGQGNTSEKHEYSYIDESIELGTTYWYKIVDVDFNGVRYAHTPVSVTLDPAPVPKSFELGQNYPNPFNPETRIEFGVPDEGRRVRIMIGVYNILGQRVRTLINKEYEPGYYHVVWDGMNDSGQQLASGVYILRLQSEFFVKTRKMLLVR